jgi:hypothetical protein
MNRNFLGYFAFSQSGIEYGIDFFGFDYFGLVLCSQLKMPRPTQTICFVLDA